MEFILGEGCVEYGVDVLGPCLAYVFEELLFTGILGGGVFGFREDVLKVGSEGFLVLGRVCDYISVFVADD